MCEAQIVFQKKVQYAIQELGRKNILLTTRKKGRWFQFVFIKEKYLVCSSKNARYRALATMILFH